jgi:hypothetical protein
MPVQSDLAVYAQHGSAGQQGCVPSSSREHAHTTARHNVDTPKAPTCHLAASCVCRSRATAGMPYLYSHQRSYLGGAQCQSHMRTGPSIVIGTDDRNEDRKHTFSSKEMHRATAAGGLRDSPGPGQYACSSAVWSPSCFLSPWMAWMDPESPLLSSLPKALTLSVRTSLAMLS